MANARKPERPVRNPIGNITGRRDIINFNRIQKDPTKVYRVVNDVDSRIEDLKDLGYEVVQADGKLGDASLDNSRGLGSAVTKPVGVGVTGVLMACDKNVYDERQKAKDEYSKSLLKQQIDDAKRSGLEASLTIS
jgi:hypothetical protein